MIILRDIDGTAHIVGLSGGKDSTCLALALKERTNQPLNFVCTPTGDELPEMAAHWERCEELLGQSIIRLDSGKTLDSLIAGYKALPNWRQRWCTRELKIEPYDQFLRETAADGPVVSYIGLRADEEGREGVDYAKNIANVTCLFPLREWGWGLAEVWEFLDERGVIIPKRTDCARCYGQRLSEWRDLWRDYPALYAEAEAQEVATGHTFRSPGRDTWPASLADLRREFESNRPLRERRDRKEGVCRACSL